MVSFHRHASAIVLSATLLSASGAARTAAQQDSRAEDRSEQVLRQFDKVAKQFRVAPYGYGYGYDHYSSYFYYDFYPYAGDATMRDPYRPAEDSYRLARGPEGPVRDGVPLPISRARILADIVLIAGLRTLLYAAVVGLLAQMVPKRVWTPVLEGNNMAVAIVLAAIAVALGIVIAAPLR
jgi:hypothetical protein